MKSREKKLQKLIMRSRGIADAAEFFGFGLDDVTQFGNSAQAVLNEVPPSFGACVMLSSLWTNYLREDHDLPAIAVAGDLNISGVPVFKHERKLPSPTRRGRVIRKDWSGHCWVELNGYVGDLSVFRTAYSLSGASRLKDYIIKWFGPGRGAFVCEVYKLPPGMQYVPREVLTDEQTKMFSDSLAYQLQHGL